MEEEKKNTNMEENEINSTENNFVDIFDSNNKIEKITNIEYENPFSEEFDPADVINRGSPADLLKTKQEEVETTKINKTEPFYISKKELDYLISDNPRINIYKKDSEGNLINTSKENNYNLSNELEYIKDDELIEIAVPIEKKEIKNNIIEIENDGYYHHNNDYDEDEDYYISDEESDKLQKEEKMQQTLKSVQDVIDELSNDEKYVNPDDLFRDFLQDNFKDYLLAKNISGNSDVKYTDKILPKEKINETNKSIEVTDFHNKHSLGKQKTSVIINRNEYAEIESIEVYCKCGEKTIIRFQEQDISPASTNKDNRSVEIKSNTEVVVDTLNVLPIYTEKDNQELTEEY